MRGFVRARSARNISAAKLSPRRHRTVAAPRRRHSMEGYSASASQFISGETGAKYYLGRPELGRAFRAAVLYRF